MTIKHRIASRSNSIAMKDLHTDDKGALGSEVIEHYGAADAAGPVMRSKSDDVSVWKAAAQYKSITLLAMTAAFCASLDGYRE